jgi:hypothetical protein
MNVVQASKLVKPAIVRTIPGTGKIRGFENPASQTGQVVSVGETVSKNIYGVEYVWISIRLLSGRVETWPSNRLEVVV